MTATRTKSVKADSFANSNNNELSHQVYLAVPQEFIISGNYNKYVKRFVLNATPSYNPIRVFFVYNQYTDTDVSSRVFPNIFSVSAFLLGKTSEDPLFHTNFSFDNYGNEAKINLAMNGQEMDFVRWRLDVGILENRPALTLVFELYGRNLPSNEVELLHTFYGRSYFDYYTAEQRQKFLNNYKYYESWNASYSTGAYQGTYEEGYNAGVATAQTNAYNQGFAAGQSIEYGNTGINQIVQTIVQSPIDFVTQVFNTEIFGYNIAGIIFTIISLGLTIFIVKLIFTFIGK